MRQFNGKVPGYWKMRHFLIDKKLTVQRRHDDEPFFLFNALTLLPL